MQEMDQILENVQKVGNNLPGRTKYRKLSNQNRALPRKNLTRYGVVRILGANSPPGHFSEHSGCQFSRCDQILRDLTRYVCNVNGEERGALGSSWILGDIFL